VAAYGDIKIAKQTIGKAIDPAMNDKLLTSTPRIANDHGLAHVPRLGHHVELAEAIGT